MSSLSDILTREELDILSKFRKSVEDILQPKHGDRYLLRWLQARNFKLRDAEDMLRKNVAWRKLTRADDILQTYRRCEVIMKYWPVGLLGFDKTGCPMWLFRIGETDMRGLAYSTSRNDCMLYFAFVMEMNEFIMETHALETGIPLDGIAAIVDMDNFPFSSLACTSVIRKVKDITGWLEANYPEMITSISIVNAPTFMQMVLSVMKSLLNERTYNKIHVYGRDEAKEKLLEQIDETVLPVHYGGKRIGANNDVYGYDLVPKGSTVPTSYYIQCKLSNEEDAEIVEVKAQAYHKVEIQVDKPKSILSWEFRTTDHNIIFGLFYVTRFGLEEVIACEKRNCHSVPENGSWLCCKAGIYILKFDNSYSWIRSKTLRYLVEVIPPVNDC